MLGRWDPVGTEQLLAAQRGGAGAVVVVGPDGSGKTSIAEEIAALDSSLQIVTSPAAATVALVVLDAGAALGSGALQSISELRDSGLRIVFALNKIDAHRDWRSVAQLDADRLSGFGAVQLHPVSARLAKLARTLPDPERARVLRTNSGLPALQTILGEHAAADTDRAGIVWRATERLALRVRERILAESDRLREVDPTGPLRGERARLVAARDGGRAAGTATVRSQIQLVRVALLHEVGERVRALNSAARADIDRSKRAALAGFPDRFAGLVAAGTEELDAVILARLSELAPDAAVQLPDAPRPAVPDGPEPRRRGLEDRMMIVVGASAGVGLGRLAVSPLAMVPALEIASIPATLLLGGGAAWWLMRSRSSLADRAHLRTWTADTLSGIKAQLEQRVVSAVLATETELSERVARDSAVRVVQVDEQIAALDAEIRNVVAKRSAQVAACERDLGVVERGIVAFRRAAAT